MRETPIEYYPVVIRESRYRGAYARGVWVLMAGLRSPSMTDAFGSDEDCVAFWTNAEADGPVIEIESPRTGAPVEVYVASGDGPTELYEAFLSDVKGDDEGTTEDGLGGDS